MYHQLSHCFTTYRAILPNPRWTQAEQFRDPEIVKSDVTRDYDEVSRELDEMQMAANTTRSRSLIGL